MERTKQDKSSHCFKDKISRSRFLLVYFLLFKLNIFTCDFFIEYDSFDIFDIVLFLHPAVEQLTDPKVNTLPVLVRRLSAEYWAARSLRQQIRDRSIILTVTHRSVKSSVTNIAPKQDISHNLISLYPTFKLRIFESIHLIEQSIVCCLLMQTIILQYTLHINDKLILSFFFLNGILHFYNSLCCAVYHYQATHYIAEETQ